MNTQFRFYAIVEATDKKTNVYKLKWIQPVGSELYYELPVELQNLNKHPEICAISKVNCFVFNENSRNVPYIYAYITT